jgi:hypothetical protein
MIEDKKIQVLIYFTLLIFFPWLMSGKPTSKGDKLFNKAMVAYTKRDFGRTLKFAGRITSGDDLYMKSRLLLADVYRETDSLSAELKCLEIVAGSDNNPLIFYRLGECYYKTGTYDKGLSVLSKYLETGSDKTLVSKANRLIGCCRFAIEAVKTPITFQPENLGNNINSIWDDYWPSLTVDGKTLIFTRLIPADGKSSRKQEDFFESKYDSAGWQLAFPLSDLNTPANEGAQTISADGKLLFCTLCNHPDGLGSCDIFFSRLTMANGVNPVMPDGE